MGPLRTWVKGLTLSPDALETVNDRTANIPYTRLGWSSTSQRTVNAALLRSQSATYGWMYRLQPAVREVVDYIARNVAQLPLKCYERVSDTERERDEEHPAAVAMQKPDGTTPRDAWIRSFVTDFLVYDDALALKFRPPADAGRLMLVRVPPHAFQVSGGFYSSDFYRIFRRDGSWFDVEPANVMHWHGYNPDDPLMGLSRLETLRALLTEDTVSQATSVELMKNGLKGGHIERPETAPPWSEEARQRFQEGWRNQAKRSPNETPVLEEGMAFKQDSISPRDAEMLGGRQFTRESVCGVYGLPPGVLGLNPSTQLDEQRKQVYADVLPPTTNDLACRFDVDILQAEYASDDHYFEFDINAKLEGDMENRFPMLTTAAGRPWLTVNEVRAIENMPPIDGPDGDALTIPMNVVLAGEMGSPTGPQLPAPNVMPPQDPNAPPQDGSYREQALPPYEIIERKQLHVSSQPRIVADKARQKRSIDKAKAVFHRHYSRQARAFDGKAVRAADAERWNKELANDLLPVMSGIVELEGGIYASRLGGGDFNMDEVTHYLEAAAAGVASGVNRATQRDISDVGATDAFKRAGQRSEVAGVSVGTRMTMFGRMEAAKQAPLPERRVMTWIADTDRHADLDGVSVPLGSDWGGIEPGSEPNCSCTAVIA